MKYFLKLIILALLFSPIGLLANNRKQADKFSFKDGDRWCAIGNSITHQGKYLEMIYMYYLTRFPYNHIELFNCGAGGDTATGTLTRRMDKDILAHNPTVATIMLGMNDIWWINSGLFPEENYTGDLERIIDRLEENGSRVILITPSPYDYSVVSEEPVDSKRIGLERLAEKVLQIGNKHNIPVVDFYNVMLNITLEQQAVDPSFTLLVKDRVHTKPLADFIMGYTFLKSANISPIVSHTIIDAASVSIVQQTNCSVNNLADDKGNILFTIQEEALPYPQSLIPEEASSFFDFNKEMNREIIQVNGLEPGQYRLYIDDLLINKYTHNQLSEGINLPLENTPQNKQSEKLAGIISEYTSVVGSKLRYIAMIEYGELKKRYDIDDAGTAESDIIKQFGEESERFEEYLQLKKEESKYMEKARNLKNQLWEENKPQSHVYRIEKK